METTKTNLKDRAIANVYNSQLAARQLMYTLASEGMLGHGYAKIALGGEPETKQLEERFENVIIELASDIIMYHEEIRDNGKVEGSL